ncbi:hypothetical protein DRP04_11925 [Archaeoglobales archaeon]|nr:MAG: hypothetical protein DRP04_11925 [Archaeoglobales archaeon]
MCVQFLDQECPQFCHLYRSTLLLYT